jgi:phospholipase C
MQIFRLGIVFVLASLSMVGGCSSSGGHGAEVPNVIVPALRSSSLPKIQHIVILIQENRTVDNLFNGYPGANTVKTGRIHTGQTIALRKTKLASVLTPPNGYRQFLTAYDDGRMDGFDLNPVEGHSGKYVYEYVNPWDVRPYWDIAKQYVLADNAFQTQGSGSFTAHQDLIAGGTRINDTQALIDFPSAMPWGCDAPSGTTTALITTSRKYLPVPAGPFPCLTYKTLRDPLDSSGVTWKYYAPTDGFAGNIWNAFDAIHAVRDGPEWKTNVSVPANALSDISAGKLASVVWLCPEFTNSDHPGSGSDTGPSWVAQVVNAIGKSKYWSSSAIIVVWDDWGGFYDHVPPKQLDYQGLGFRVPMLIVSPYAKKGYVSHTRYEFGSVVKFVEETWKLGQLGRTDVRANSIGDAFNFNQSPRPFVPFQAKYSRSFFLNQQPSHHALDDE